MPSINALNRRLLRTAALGAVLTAWCGPRTLAAESTKPVVEIGDLRLYEAMRTAPAPVIDGRLDDACWATAPIGGDFVRVINQPEKPPSVQTRFQVLYDDEFLYVAVTCAEPHPEKIKAVAVEDGSAAVCGDDSIEMFFQPDPARSEYYQMAANSKDVRYDGCGFDASWSGDWTAKASVGKDAWYLECRVALASFPARGNVWRFNVCREFRSPEEPEYHCWSDTGGGFHNPARFGHLLLSGGFATLRRGYLIEAARAAKVSLEKEEQLDARIAEIRGVRSQVPAELLKTFDERLQKTLADRAAIAKEYGGRHELPAAEWSALNKALGGLLAGLEDVYWEIKFTALLND